MAVVCALIAFRGDLSELKLTSFPLLMFWVNAWLVLISLVPYRTKVDGVRTPNDGLVLIHLLLNIKSKTSKDPAASGQDAARLSHPSWRWLIRNTRPEPFLQKYRDYLNKPALPAEARGEILDRFATSVLLYGATEFLPEAVPVFRGTPQGQTRQVDGEGDARVRSC